MKKKQPKAKSSSERIRVGTVSDQPYAAKGDDYFVLKACGHACKGPAPLNEQCCAFRASDQLCIACALEKRLRRN